MSQVSNVNRIPYGNFGDQGGHGDRFLLSYESGEWDLFEVEDQVEAGRRLINLIETDKSKEHEESLTSVDFHKNLNLIATSCLSG